MPRTKQYTDSMTLAYDYKCKWVCKYCGQVNEADRPYYLRCKKCGVYLSGNEMLGRIYPLKKD